MITHPATALACAAAVVLTVLGMLGPQAAQAAPRVSASSAGFVQPATAARPAYGLPQCLPGHANGDGRQCEPTPGPGRPGKPSVGRDPSGRADRQDDDQSGGKPGAEQESSPPTAGATGAAGTTGAADSEGEGDTDSVEGSSRDFLRDNGMRSPWCRSPKLTQEQADNCRRSGLVTTGSAADNSNFDKHIDTKSWTGAPRFTEGTISVFLWVLGFVWGACLLITRGLLFLLEFAFSFNPLDPSLAGSTAQSVNQQLGAVTRPLALVIAPVGGVWLLWTGLIEQKRSEAIKDFVTSAVLTVLVVAVLLNPLGTIGTALTASQKTGLAVIALASGQPVGDGPRSAQEGIRAMAEGVIDAPLALLEFGDVSFGNNPNKLVPELREAALKLAMKDSPEAVARVRAAKTNLDLFQVWPANSAQRNSINDEGSLLRVLCGADKDDECKGPYKRQAEFRTKSGANQRALSLLLIIAGLIPWWAVIGYATWKILAASIMTVIRMFSLVFLGALLALGKTGNQRVISVGGRLIGDVLTATMYSFFLALAMLLWRLVTGAWGGNGFVAQWLLLLVTFGLLITKHGTLWGTVKHSNSAVAGLGTRIAAYQGAKLVPGLAGGVLKTGGRAPRAAARRGREQVQALRSLSGARTRSHREPGGSGALEVAATLAGPGADAAGAVLAGGDQRRSERAEQAASEQRRGVRQAVAAELGAQGPDGRDRAARAAKRVRGTQNTQQLAAVNELRQAALADAGGLRERRAKLAERSGELSERPLPDEPRARRKALKQRESVQRRLTNVDDQLGSAEKARKGLRQAAANPNAARGRASRFLDRQAELPRGQRLEGGRDYASLAPLVGSSAPAYRQATAAEQLRSRERIDKELSRRAHAGETVTHARELDQRPTPGASSGPGGSSGRQPRPARATAGVGTGGPPEAGADRSPRERLDAREARRRQARSRGGH